MPSNSTVGSGGDVVLGEDLRPHRRLRQLGEQLVGREARRQRRGTSGGR